MLYFFNQKTAYEMRISDWSSDVCSSDLLRVEKLDEAVDHQAADAGVAARQGVDLQQQDQAHHPLVERRADAAAMGQHQARLQLGHLVGRDGLPRQAAEAGIDAVEDRKSVV